MAFTCVLPVLDLGTAAASGLSFGVQAAGPCHREEKKTLFRFLSGGRDSWAAARAAAPFPGDT